MKASLILVLKSGIEIPMEFGYSSWDKEDVEDAIINSKRCFYEAKRDGDPTFWCLTHDVSTDEVLFIKDVQ